MQTKREEHKYMQEALTVTLSAATEILNPPQAEFFRKTFFDFNTL